MTVATAAHWPLVHERLHDRGCDTAMLGDAGLLIAADADETLAAICEDGAPSRSRFTEVIGGLIEQAATRSATGRVRVFGEMVDLLCRRGHAAAADALEELWNRLGGRSFTLLCGYKIDVFDRAAQVSLLPQVYRSHSQVLPVADAERLDAAVSAALTEVLGERDAHKVFGQISLREHEERVPRAQLALLWISAHMPRTAERVLAAARTRYVDSTPAAAA